MSRDAYGSRWPSLDQLWALLAVALPMWRVLLTPIMPHDFWWHLATGRLIALEGSIPTADRFSYTQAGAAYYNQPWLAQVLMYSGYRLGGAELLQLLQAIIIGMSFALLYRVSRREGAGPRLAAAITLAGGLVAMDNWQIRPQSYAIPLFVATLALLLRWRRSGDAPLWLLPPIMIVWVNLHGTFILLPVLCASVWLGTLVERRRQREARARADLIALAGWSAGALLASLLNPRGPAIYSYVAGLLRDRAVAELVAEWVSPFRDLASPMTIVFWIMLTIFGLLLLRRRQRLTPTAILLLLPFLGLALQSVRNILWLGIVAVPITSWLLATPLPNPRRRSAESVALNRAIAALVLVPLVVCLPWWKAALGLPPAVGRVLHASTPIVATEQLRGLPQRPARLFHEMSFGSYLIWAAPEQRVFIDPRIELYRYEQWRDYIALGQGRDVEALAAEYRFDGWLVNPDSQPELVESLTDNPRWQRVFETDEAIYFGPASASTHR